MYARKAFLGLGLLQPKTVLAMQIMKLHIGYKRVRRNVTEMIQMCEESTMNNSGYQDSW